MYTTNCSVHVHEKIVRKCNPPICEGKRQRLMWGSEVDVVIPGKHGRVLVRWFDGLAYWYGWTYADCLVKTLDEVFPC